VIICLTKWSIGAHVRKATHGNKEVAIYVP